MATSFKIEDTNTANTSTVLPGSTEFGVQDIIRQGPSSRIDQELTRTHPLEARLANWESAQLSMKLHMQRRIYGLHAPLRTMMEIQSVKQSPFALNAGASRLQLDILTGKDETVDVEDVYNDHAEAELPDVHMMLASRLSV
ncbi:proteasome maturation factor UMP1 [Martensiomyces pterosporus]|nr:proteasome maturation factor UMP1 [Martensiomyces pterosporus]